MKNKQKLLSVPGVRFSTAYVSLFSSELISASEVRLGSFSFFLFTIIVGLLIGFV